MISDVHHDTINTSQRTIPCFQPIIFAQNEQKAEAILQLYWDSFLIYHGQVLLLDPHMFVDELVDPTQICPSDYDESTYGVPGLAESAALVAVLAGRLNRRYAAHKLAMSMRTVNVPAVELDPGNGVPFPPSRNPAAHVAYANAIILAYSAIEELGLEVRSSRDRPSTIDGTWNPIVRRDLEERLQKAGISLSDRYDWIYRGGKRAIERRYAALDATRSRWASGWARDKEIDIAEAVRLASQLRSRISSHRLGRLAANLTAHDVANVQHLARRLLLESTGVWGKLGEPADVVT